MFKFLGVSFGFSLGLTTFEVWMVSSLSLGEVGKRKAATFGGKVC